MRVALEEHSNVLTASAFHHRSDAYSSIVALLAIGGSWVGLAVADPLGGLVVAGMIAFQGVQVGYASVAELLDQAAEPHLASDLRGFVADQGASSSAVDGQPLPQLRGVDKLRTFKSGGLHLLDVVVEVDGAATARQLATLERDLAKRVRAQFPSITEVAVRWRAR
jgi:divalent metal cation (Fe/Co/Zn/Cd) transporter